MGLFSRTNESANGQEDFDEIDLPNSDDLKGGLFTSERVAGASNEAAPAPARRAATSPQSRGLYGIEDAIKLMKSLPRDNNEVVVTVVKKTLESTQIRVPDIVADANQKESRIRNQHKTLEGEIKELQEQIAQRNQQISDLLQDLKETTDVRQRLQLAMELDGDAIPATKATANQTPTQTAPGGEQTNYGGADSVEAQNNPNNVQAGVANPVTSGTADPANNLRRRAQQRSNPPH